MIVLYMSEGVFIGTQSSYFTQNDYFIPDLNSYNPFHAKRSFFLSKLSFFSFWSSTFLMSSYLGLSRFLLRFFSNSRMSSEVKSLSSLDFVSFFLAKTSSLQQRLFLLAKSNFHIRSASFPCMQTLLWKSLFQLQSFRG